jgi:hypothetical protein
MNQKLSNFFQKDYIFNYYNSRCWAYFGVVKVFLRIVYDEMLRIFT